MNSELKEFLKPDRYKVIVSLLLPYFFIGVAIRSFLAFGIGVFLIESIFVYPFICSLFAIVRAFRERKIRKTFSSKTNLLLIVVGLIFFNPLNAILYFNMLYLFVISAFYYPPMPMVEIVSIAPDSPFIESGLKPGYKIYTVETYNSAWVRIDKTTRKEEIKNYRKFRIHNTSEYFASLNNAAIGERIKQTTINGDKYTITKTQNITDWGIDVKDITSKRWLFP
jgi:hypothetical protein